MLAFVSLLYIPKGLELLEKYQLIRSYQVQLHIYPL